MMGQNKERKWGSSGSAQPRQRLPSALKKPVESEQGRWARPPSAVRPPSARPDSRRLIARPSSRLDSRLDSYLDSGSRPVSRQDITRPKSGVRPLSGKVFMRRTTDHGWVAKAYDVNEPMGTLSQPDLNLFDDLSDCESLDSFFDEDFEVQTSEEKLGHLLSCNTLGVESKSKKPDWVAGMLGVPKFHCPRCRDHWYGLTDVPCDEELARLIREGLWKTGNEGGGKARRGGRGGRDHKKGEKDRDYRSHSSITLSAKSSSTHLSRDAETEGSKGQRGSSQTNDEKDSKKRKKRITFKLDNDFEDSSTDDNSRSQLDNYGGYKRADGSKSFGDGLSSGPSRQVEASGPTGGGADGTNGVRSDGGVGRDGSNGGGADGLDGAAGKKRQSGVDSDDTGIGSSDSGLLNNDSLGGRRKTGKSSDGKLLTGESQEGNIREDVGRGRRNKHSSSSQGVDGDDQSASNFGGRQNREEEGASSPSGVENGATNGLGVNSSVNGESSEVKSNQKSSNGPSSQSLSSSSQVRSTTGSRRGSISAEDHGKNVRKPGGHMRAAGPNSSEWADPTHARPYISSTATSRTVSRCGSAVNLGQTEDDDKNGRVSLPPIVPAISNKKPLLDLSDIMGGFQFTRAWTFSYHRK